MRFFFDNNISPKIAHALNCLVQPQHEVVHLRDRFDPATPDKDWMTKLANELDWVIISADTAISRNPHEVEAWKQGGHPIFFFKHSLLHQTFWQQASDDSAGLDAMQQLALSAGDSARHFLIPLPPNLPDTAPELFGFFTYEVRIGHAQGWSTAQARFGLPLRVTGVQHPTPPLTCLVSRQAAGITASAPFALPVANGQVLLSQRPFQTQIWILLYAQVLQADGVSSRNVLLGQAPAQFQAKTLDGQTGPQPHGVAHWDQADLLGRLAALNLSADASLSVLAVEFLPEPSAAFADPLGADLGQVRILRTSPLTPVDAICVEE